MQTTLIKRSLGAIGAAVVTLLTAVPAHAWTQNAHYWASVGVFSRFNVVTRDDFTAKSSDMQCGFAAGGNANLQLGYTVGKSQISSVGASATVRPQVGMLVSGDLNWTNSPSGTIDGDVFLGGTSKVTLATDSSVTLLPGNKAYKLTGNELFSALTPELWVGWNADTANWGYNSLNPNNPNPGAAGWTGHSEIPLKGAFQQFFDTYLGNMSGGLLITPANGDTEVTSYAAPRKNIMLDGKNLGRCDMPGNAGNCSAASGAPNGQPGGRRAVYVFDIDAADLSSADEVRAKNIRATDEFGAPTWTVIKVKANGKNSVQLARMGLQDLAGRNTRTMWVFDPAIKTITVDGVGIEGTFLAPGAAVIANNGNINGSIIAKSFTGTLEGHCAPFNNYIDP